MNVTVIGSGRWGSFISWYLSGMGFSVMEAFMDSVEVESKPDEGTVVTMKKRIADASERSNG